MTSSTAANTRPAADSVNAKPVAVTAANSTTDNSGKIQADRGIAARVFIGLHPNVADPSLWSKAKRPSALLVQPMRHSNAAPRLCGPVARRGCLPADLTIVGPDQICCRL